VNTKDPYGSYCAGMMYDLLCKYPSSFWASPGEFFTGEYSLIKCVNKEKMEL